MPLPQDELVQALTRHNGRPGYGQVVVNADTNELLLYWKGSPPDEVAELLGVGSDGTHVRLMPAPFSAREIRDASQRLLEDARAQCGPGVVGGVSGTRDLSGRIIYTTKRLDLARLRLVAEMPLQQEIGDPVVPLRAPRD